MVLQTNQKLGKRFAKRLMKLYNTGFFGEKIHAKFSPPKNAKTRNELLMYYFFVLSVDYGMKAEPLFERMRNLHEKSREWFSPAFLRKKSMEEIVEKMKELKMRFPVQAALRWKKNAEMLEEIGDDIERVFSGDSKQILSNIQGFYGFGEKLSRLLLRTVVDTGIIDVPEGFEEMELPTDIHVVKIAFRAGLLSGEKPDYGKHAKIARKEWTAVAKSIKEVPAALDRALWVLGAEWCSRKRCKECPLHDICLLPTYKN